MRKAIKMKTISIVIPVFNEIKRIQKTLDSLKKGFNFDGLKLKEVVFVDDGSKDHIKEKIAKESLGKYLKADIKIISYQPNQGRGYAVKIGALNCSSDYVLYADADFSIPLANLTNFLPYLKKDYDLIFGSKKKPGARQIINRGLLRNIVGLGHSLIASFSLGVFAWDFQGGFKIFSRHFIEEVFPMLTLDRWGFDMEVIFLGKKLGFKTKELPVCWSHIDKGSKVKLMRDISRSLNDMKSIRDNWLKKDYFKPVKANYVSSV
jgi:glycosyltransferase involved in cell wall biosynthesis